MKTRQKITCFRDTPLVAFYLHGHTAFNSEAGLLERGAYAQNQMTRTYLVAFQFFYLNFAESRYNFTAEIHKFDTVFIRKHAKINMQDCVAK